MLREVMQKAAMEVEDFGTKQRLLSEAGMFYGGKKVIYVLNSLQQLAALESRIRSKQMGGEIEVDLCRTEPQSFWELSAFSSPARVSKVCDCVV